MPEDRLKIAVFVDFDNIEIGVKNTLNRRFDISAVLEAIKERGEIATKIAYGDWKRAGDYGRQMGQHAFQMVQRNLTPGGDKNGADINLALDALEMAFTLGHINAFVIVGGDSDFMTLVEKLKQYDKKVMIVGGRGFTSSILQKNCHEFIAYENLIRTPTPTPSRKQQGGGKPSRSSGGDRPIGDAIPLVRRALKVLSDREVSPQLGLLKSTLLQLDSTFSERDYGATSFRDFIEKLAGTGVVSLKQVDRSLLVELVQGEEEPPEEAAAAPDTAPEAVETPPSGQIDPSKVDPALIEEGIALIRSAFDKAESPLKWPLYVRGVKQFLKSVIEGFDERAYGFTGLLDALRQSQKAGVFQLERNRQGVLRVYPGEAIMPSPAVATSLAASTNEAPMALEEAAAHPDEVGAETAGEDPAEISADGAESSRKAKTRKKPSKKTTRKKTTKKKTTKKASKKTSSKGPDSEPAADASVDSPDTVSADA